MNGKKKQAESSSMRAYDLKIGEHWISDALSVTVSILSFFVVPLNFSNYHWIASINEASTEYISSFFSLPLFSIPRFSLDSFFLSSFSLLLSFFFYLSFCRLERHISAKRVRRNGKRGNIESAGKANKAGISRPLDYLCSEPLYYNLSTIHGTMICLTSYEPSQAFGFPISGLEYAVDRWFKFKRVFRKSIFFKRLVSRRKNLSFLSFLSLHFSLSIYIHKIN